MNKIAVFPGSFDPFTIGHESIIKRGIPLFDKIIVAIGYNSTKKGFFSLDTRRKWIEAVFAEYPQVIVDSYEGLTIDFCEKVGATYLLRGLRTASDFEYERSIAQMNKYMAEGIESVFLLTTPELTPVNSTIVRDIIRHGGDASQFLPKEINLNISND